MAVGTKSNTITGTTASTLMSCTGKPVKVTHIVLFPTGANAYINIDDGTTRKLSYGIATSYDTRLLDFSANPIVFTTSVVIQLINTMEYSIVFKQD